jgi:hypothetical protein
MLGHQNLEIKHFIGSPRNVHDINMTLPPKLRRSHGSLDDFDLQIYSRYEEIGDSLVKYMEEYGLQDPYVQESSVEEDNQSETTQNTNLDDDDVIEAESEDLMEFNLETDLIDYM